jgi:hypothetical protein
MKGCYHCHNSPYSQRASPYNAIPEVMKLRSLPLKQNPRTFGLGSDQFCSVIFVAILLHWVLTKLDMSIRKVRKKVGSCSDWNMSTHGDQLRKSFRCSEILNYVHTSLSILCQLSIAWEISVFWDIRQCNPLKVNRCFGVIIRLHLQGRRISQARSHREAGRKQSSIMELEAKFSSETSVDFQQTNGILSQKK